MSEKKLFGKPFQPGRSGNPDGRPKGFERRLRAVLESMTADDPMPDPSPDAPKDDDGNPPRIPAFEAIVKRAVLDAIAGDRYARDFIADRLMGKAPQRVTVTDDSAVSTNWSAVPIEKRRELLDTLELVAPGGDVTEH